MTKLGNCPTGLSNAGLEPADYERFARAGITVLELSRTCDWECYLAPDYVQAQKDAQKAGLTIRSLHLPFGGNIDFTVPATRDFAEKINRHLIRRASEAGIGYVILHPSSEPVPDAERAERLLRCRESLAELAEFAAPLGVTVCVENLPRTCLGRTGAELKELISGSDKLRVCFDTNHLLMESHADFVKAVSDKIISTHISDYDFVDERHWMPGMGKIDWQELRGLLEGIGYDGPFLYECRLWRGEGQPDFPLETYRSVHKNISEGSAPL